MAYTDAISVACKLLGFGADVYWAKDNTKYDKPQEEKHICEDCKNEVTATEKKTVAEIVEGSKKFYNKVLCQACVSKRYKAQKEGKNE
jgi:uncharacterized protein with PIN domain